MDQRILTEGDLEKLRGKSAYEIAVSNGFKGTEKEWLESLKGESGGVSLSTSIVDGVFTLTSQGNTKHTSSIVDGILTIV